MQLLLVFLQSSLFCCLCFHTCWAQGDPFSAGFAKDAAALSPNELPSFQDYQKDPENIKIADIKSTMVSGVLKSTREPIVILDARNQAEFEIAHLQDAKWVGFDDFSIERVWMIQRETRVLVYSSLNKRSKLIAQYLILLGFRDVQIMEDGIIGWVNNNYPVYDATHAPTTKIHVGDKQNMKYLKKGLGIY